MKFDNFSWLLVILPTVYNGLGNGFKVDIIMKKAFKKFVLHIRAVANNLCESGRAILKKPSKKFLQLGSLYTHA